MQLEPFEKFALFRGLENHLDATTYYVRAVIRNGKTAALIATVDLTDNGNREFSKEWEVPADVNGNGFYITITYSVYTDAGYTTKSDNYGDKYEEHLVLHRITENRTPGGPDINYKKIQKMIDDSVSKIKFPDPEKVDLKPVLKAIAENKVEIPPQKEVDLSALVTGLTAIQTHLVEMRARPKFEKTDISPLFDMYHDLHAEVEKINLPTGIKAELNGILEKVKTFFDADMEEIKGYFKEISEYLKSIQYLIPKTGDNQPLKKVEEKPTDFVALANEEAGKRKNE